MNTTTIPARVRTRTAPPTLIAPEQFCTRCKSAPVRSALRPGRVAPINGAFTSSITLDRAAAASRK